MKIAIVYELIQEETKIYVEEVSAEEWKWISRTHGRYLNAQYMSPADEEACIKLSSWLKSKTSISFDYGPLMLRGAGFDYLVHSGFML